MNKLILKNVLLFVFISNISSSHCSWMKNPSIFILKCFTAGFVGGLGYRASADASIKINQTQWYRFLRNR